MKNEAKLEAIRAYFGHVAWEMSERAPGFGFLVATFTHPDGRDFELSETLFEPGADPAQKSARLLDRVFDLIPPAPIEEL